MLYKYKFNITSYIKNKTDTVKYHQMKVAQYTIYINLLNILVEMGSLIVEISIYCDF